MTIKLVPNQVAPGGGFNLIYTGPTAPDSTTVCTASNTANDTKWGGTAGGPVPDAGGTVPLIAPAKANIYTYTISCTTGTGSSAVTEAASAFLFDGVPIPVPTDCGVTDNFGQAIPTKDLLAPDAVVTKATAGLCLFCSTSQPNNVIDQDPTDYATLNKPVGVAGSEALTVTDTVNSYTAGHIAGFVVSNPAQLLTLELLQGFTVNTYLKGALQDSAGVNNNPLRLDLLTLLASPKSKFLGFTTAKDFDAVQIVSSGLVSVIGQANVYQACISTQLASSSSSSSGGSSSSSGSSGGSSSSSSSSSGGSSGSSSGATPPAGAVSISVAPADPTATSPVITPGGSFKLTYTGPGTTGGNSCTATNSAGDPNWAKVVADTGGSLTLTAPNNPNIYTYSLSCSVPLGGTSSATASLYVGLPAPIAVDCGAVTTASNGTTTPFPTLSWTDADASVATGSSGICVACSVQQPQNVLNQDPTNYAIVNSPVGLLSTETLVATNKKTFTAGHTAGFIASQPSELITANLLGTFSISTLLNGKVQETATGSTALLHLDLLTLLNNPSASFVSFKTTKDFNGLAFTDGNLLSVLGQANLYQACVSAP